MRKYLRKNVCHEMKEINLKEINIKSFLIALYIIVMALLCYFFKILLNSIFPDNFKDRDYIFNTILDPNSVSLYSSIACAAMTVSILLTVFKCPVFFRLRINDIDVISPILSIFYICFVLSVISYVFGHYKFYYMIFYFLIIVFINRIIKIYRTTKRDIIDKTRPRHQRILQIIVSLILNICMLVLSLKDVNISS